MCYVCCCGCCCCAGGTSDQPDICCLQEVDDKVFSEYLQPHLRLSNFRGHYTNKQGKVREGSAMFWSDSKWGCAAVQDILLRV
jgi:2',5'-phosphodiesterase